MNIHTDVDECVAGTRESLAELTGTLADLATQAGIVTGLVDTISRAMSRVPDPSTSFQHRPFLGDSSDSFVDYQTRMVAASKEIARLAQEMVSLLIHLRLVYNRAVCCLCPSSNLPVRDCVSRLKIE